MAGNAWTARRSVIRRPIVCKSKPKPEEESPWPPTIRTDYTWVQDRFPIDINSETQPLITIGRIGEGPRYLIAGFNDQGDAYIGDITLAYTPGICLFYATMLTGPFQDEEITGQCIGPTEATPWTVNGTMDLNPPTTSGGFNLYNT